MTDRDIPTSFDPETSNELPAEPAGVLREQPYTAALLRITNLGTVLLARALRHEIDSIRGRVPIGFQHELHDHPASPVIRMVTKIYRQPEHALAFETFVDVGDPYQRTNYAALAHQDKLTLDLYYADAFSLTLRKRGRLTDHVGLMRVLTTADRLLAAIPEDQRNFDRAKAEVMNQTNLRLLYHENAKDQ